MYFCDVHTHTLLSPDSEAPLAEMARAAAACGLDELCVTDHCDLLDWQGRPTDFFDWPAAKANFRGAPREGGLTLRLGLELGSAVFAPDAARRILDEGGQELDFVLGSLHNWIGMEGNIDLYFSRFTDNPALCRRAMENCLEHTWTLVSDYPDCYDSLAHILYPLRYIQRDGQQLALTDYEGPIRAILTRVAETGRAMEVNTCRGETVADWALPLRWFKQCGGRYVTLGSDAHGPEDMAKGIAQAAQLVRQAGFEHVTTFSGRKPVLHAL